MVMVKKKGASHSIPVHLSMLKFEVYQSKDFEVQKKKIRFFSIVDLELIKLSYFFYNSPKVLSLFFALSLNPFAKAYSRMTEKVFFF